ncbi:MAG: hypothetical protein EPO21_13000 [Chloroflexota bacterium]|nr:MAG: hypothetical protein EPO21_13000 [Chloroflexota bacterium]
MKAPSSDISTWTIGQLVNELDLCETSIEAINDLRASGSPLRRYRGALDFFTNRREAVRAELSRRELERAG